MRHAKKKIGLGLTQGERKSLILNQARSLFKHQRIVTTYSKAKLIQPVVEKLLSLAKTDTLKNRRKVFQALNDHVLVKRVFTQLGPLFDDRNGGFTHILRLRRRRGDNAYLVIFELTKRLPEEKPKVKEKKPAKKEVAEKETPPLRPEVKEVPSERPKPTYKKKEEKRLEEKEKPYVKETEKKGKKLPRLFGRIGKFFRRKQEP